MSDRESMGKVCAKFASYSYFFLRKSPLCSNSGITPKMMPVSKINLGLNNEVSTSAPIFVFYDTCLLQLSLYSLNN
jgi:hypothetical protein